jgi:hypothetical protein
MNTSFLFPNRFKILGWILFVPSFVFGIVARILDLNIDNYLNLKVFAIYEQGLFSKSVFFGFIENGFLDEIVLSFLIIGSILIGFSKLKVEDEFSRAAPGGVGFTKCAGNYGAALYPTALAQKEGYDQILWTDPIEHEWVEETGTTNFFAVYGKTVITPSLTNTMLAGITRDSVIKGLKHLGYTVEERPISITELIEKQQAAEISELFITGTAATLMNLDGFGRNGTYYSVMESPNHEVSTAIKTFLDNIKLQKSDDPMGWNIVL